MKTVRKFFSFLLCMVVLIYFPLSGEENKDIIIEAMTDELARSMKSLRIEDMDRPYFIEYTILDKQVLQIEADFGSLTKSEENQDRLLKVGLRVGSYQLDSTGFLSRASLFSSFRGTQGTVIEDDYNAVRHDLWLATDTAYKEALEQLANKNAYLKTNVQAEKIPDFSKEKSVQLVAPRKTMKVDRAKWEKIAKNLSAVFRSYPAIHASGVKIQIENAHKYYVNSEGTVFRQPEPFVSLVAHASTQAPDGMKLKHYIPFYASAVTAIPGEKELAAGIRNMAQELTALAKAPVLEEYFGPVLFTRQASAELFAQVLAPHFSGERPPLSSDARLAETVFSSKLAQRINRRVMPREISITSDPTLTNFAKTALSGTYAVDDQGVPARAVKLVESGVLKTLLMSRRPRKEIPYSNGHARAGSMGNVGVQIANLIVTTNKGKTYKELKKELIQLCKEQQLPFGLIIKTVDNPGITGVDLSITSLMMMRSGQTPQGMTNPVMVYKVHVPDGREELIRGITFSEIDLRSFKDIVAVGNDYFVHHRRQTGSGSLSQLSFAFSLRGRGDTGIPASIIAPSVLVEELEFKKSTETLKNPPLLGHPFFLH